MDQKCVRKDSPYPALQKNALRIYSMRFCPYAQRARLVLEHKQIPYETININFNSKPQWFWDRNPTGSVPILEKGDQVVYESTATCEWLDDVYTHNKLTPSDPYIKAKDRILLENFGKIASLFYVKLRNPETLEEGIRELHKQYQYYETELSKREGPLFGGKKPAMIDFFMWPHMERLPVLARKDARISVTDKSFPYLAIWYSAMYDLQAVKNTMFSLDDHQGFLDTISKGKIDFDYGL